jgi:acylphosphatase
MSDAIVRRRVLVTGRVQGVWYRASVAREAEAAGLSGYARNEPDGSVLVELEGPPAAVAAVIAWCEVGPPRAEVARLTVEAIPVLGTTTFEVG